MKSAQRKHAAGGKKCTRWLLSALLPMFFVPMQAQNLKQITGKVIDDKGEPVIGASVVVPQHKGMGTVTDIDGKFTLSVPANSSIDVSFIGYVTKKINVDNRKAYNIVLAEDMKTLDETVVVGYGTQKKATITGSVTAVSGDQIVSTKGGNIQNMLTGKLPGVRNIQITSEPGQFTNQFDIRGLGAPLLVVDGVPRGDMPRMDPNDVESISVLKDAAAAIYGVRAANGVILVTTKSGKSGKAKIEYSAYYGIQTPAERLKPLGTWDRAILYNETTMRNNVSPKITYDDDYFKRVASGEIANTDWYKEVMRNAAPQSQQNVAISGGTNAVNYYVNFGYNGQDGFFKTNSSNYHRFNLRTNLNAQITKNLRAGIRLNMISDETNRQKEGSWKIFNLLWRAKPEDPVYANNTAPYYFHPNVETNVVAQIHPEITGFAKYKKEIFQSNMELEWTVPFVKGLKTKVMYSYDKTWNDNTDFSKEFNEYRYNAATKKYDALTQNSKTNLKRAFSTSYSALWNAQIAYDNTFIEKHHVGAMLLYEESYNQGYDFNAYREFEIAIPYLFAGNTLNQVANGSGLSESANRALVGRFNYDYEGKYIGEFSFRYDGSSKFPKGKQWGFFPSVLLAYRISEESFFKKVAPFVTNLKIRGSWGKLGDDAAADNFQFVEGYNYPMSGANKANLPGGYIFNGSVFTNALGFRDIPNMDLTWYKSTMLNLGVDADLWNGLFGFSFDLFKRSRDGLIGTPAVVVPQTFGTGLSQANMNADETKGFELELRHRYHISDFNYSITGSVSLTRSMWTKLVQSEFNNSYDNWRNNKLDRYMDVWFAYGKGGTYQNFQDIENSVYSNAGTLPGDPYYQDWNGDGVIDGNDYHPVATTTNPGTDGNNRRNYPLMNFSINLSGQWRYLDFNMLFQGAAMSNIGYSEQLLNPLMWDGNALGMLFDRWHPVDPKKDPYDPTNQWVKGWYPYGKTRADANSKFNIQNGAYMRLKSVEIGFTVPKNTLFQSVGIQNLRLYVNAYNLFTITGVKGLDPEHPSQTYGYMYPLNRTYNFGGSITF